jgi:predicted nicotinamide N-methyase
MLAWNEELAEAPPTLTFETEDEDEESSVRRVREWSSSSSNPDGIGGIHGEDTSGKSSETGETGAVKIVYVLSESWHGFGGQVWASSRHVANLLADSETCQKLLVRNNQEAGEVPTPNHHPLSGVSFVELGAGAGIPSWTAMWCGARVVCTDQAVADRIRCLAESMERNWREMEKAGLGDDADPFYEARACPYDWGNPIDEVLLASKKDSEQKRFDVVVAADCCYMPLLHSDLLDSIDMLMAEHGVALLPFALHGNTDDDSVWGIVDLADKKGFQVEVLEPRQLTPQNRGMDTKQALVHTLRLTRR